EPIPIERLDEIERLIGVLAERFSPVEPDYTALAAIESQIARIAENLDSSHERISGLAEFEQSLSDLLHRFEEEQASNEAVGYVRRDFIELRAMVESSDERTQETLAAVRETLDRIVDRLADLDEEVEEVSEDSPEARARPGETAAV